MAHVRGRRNPSLSVKHIAGLDGFTTLKKTLKIRPVFWQVHTRVTGRSGFDGQNWPAETVLRLSVRPVIIGFVGSGVAVCYKVCLTSAFTL